MTFSFHKLKKRLKDTHGGESLEMLVTSSIIAFVALTLIMIMIWVYNYYGTTTICRKLARHVEITGVYDETELTTLAESLSGVEDPNAYNYIVVNGYYLDGDGEANGEIPDGARLQLTTSFAITVETHDRLPFAMLGKSDVTVFDVPISCSTSGISEMYFKGA